MECPNASVELKLIINNVFDNGGTVVFSNGTYAMIDKRDHDVSRNWQVGDEVEIITSKTKYPNDYALQDAAKAFHFNNITRTTTAEGEYLPKTK